MIDGLRVLLIAIVGASIPSALAYYAVVRLSKRLTDALTGSPVFVRMTKAAGKAAKNENVEECSCLQCTLIRKGVAFPVDCDCEDCRQERATGTSGRKSP